MIPEAFHEFVQVLPEPVVLLDHDGCILSANAPLAQLLGRPVRALTEQPFHTFLSDPPEMVRAYLGRCSRSREVIPGAVHVRREDDGDQAFRCEGAVLRPWSPEAGAVLFLRLKPHASANRRFLLLNRKIEELGREIQERMRVEEALRTMQDELEQRVAERTTALTKANQELHRSNEALQNFASIASHDLREPLRKIVSFGNLLQSQVGDNLDPESRFLLERMRSAAVRMDTFVRNLLEFSRVSTEPHRFEAVDLNAIVQDVLADLDVRITETGAQVRVDPLPVVEADASQVHQLFQNLLSNALKFHQPKEPPIIHIGSRRLEAAPAYELRVEDRGIGFEPEAAERIFNIFQRLHGRSEYEGTGIGLAICKRIVERHGGHIRAEGQTGVGTTFFITLPERQHAPAEG